MKQMNISWENKKIIRSKFELIKNLSWGFGHAKTTDKGYLVCNWPGLILSTI